MPSNSQSSTLSINMEKRKCPILFTLFFCWLNCLLLVFCVNQDSMLKSRDITLPTKVGLVKAMVFPVVMYGCESWTVKKAEH